MIKICKHCDESFNLLSAYKRRVGGYINECPSCVEELGTETAPVVRGFVTGDGKMASMQILKFTSESDANRYSKNWNNNSGWQNRRTGSINEVKFSKIGENMGNVNHKGKL